MSKIINECPYLSGACCSKYQNPAKECHSGNGHDCSWTGAAKYDDDTNRWSVIFDSDDEYSYSVADRKNPKDSYIFKKCAQQYERDCCNDIIETFSTLAEAEKLCDHCNENGEKRKMHDKMLGII